VFKFIFITLHKIKVGRINNRQSKVKQAV